MNKSSKMQAHAKEYQSKVNTRRWEKDRTRSRRNEQMTKNLTHRYQEK